MPAPKRPLCGAKTRAGGSCQAQAVPDPKTGRPRNGRCKMHGGLSTGPKTAAGYATSTANLRSITPLRTLEQIAALAERAGDVETLTLALERVDALGRGEIELHRLLEGIPSPAKYREDKLREQAKLTAERLRKIVERTKVLKSALGGRNHIEHSPDARVRARVMDFTPQFTSEADLHRIRLTPADRADRKVDQLARKVDRKLSRGLLAHDEEE